MSNKEIVVSSGPGETRAAVMENRRLVEVYIERSAHQRHVGNIYKGKVENVLPGMQAAFVNIGLERNAFLYVDDALKAREGHFDDVDIEDLKALSIRDILKENQDIIVQVTKEPIGHERCKSSDSGDSSRQECSAYAHRGLCGSKQANH